MEEINQQKPVRKRESMIGKQFGMLTILERANKNTNGYAKYLCKCECGKTTVVDIRSLRKGSVTSCGCRPNNSKHYRDLEGMRKGRLTVVEKLPLRDYKGSVIWRCKCDCGNECTYSADTLLHSCVVSCGCYRRDTLPKLMQEALRQKYAAAEQTKQKTSKSGTESGVVGVRQLENGHYCAYISVQGKRRHLGTFDTLEEAVAARKAAKESKKTEVC